MIAYVREQGAKISREGRRLVVRAGESENVLFAEELERLVLFGQIHLTARAIHLLLEENIDVVFLRSDGSYRGRLVGSEEKNAPLRHRQFLASADEAFCFSAARAMIAGKLRNQAAFLAKSGHEKETAARLRDLAKEALTCDCRESLRGVEGAGAEIYFQAFPRLLKRDWNFSGRNRRPPKDPVNVILSLVYTLLANACHAAIRIAGLDPCPGCLHVPAYGRHALPLDLMEEFRPMPADMLTIALFNLGEIRPDDFEMRDASEDEPGGLKLSDRALKKTLAAFEEKMRSTIFHPRAKKELTWQESLVFQAGEFRRLLEGESGEYHPLCPR